MWQRRNKYEINKEKGIKLKSKYKYILNKYSSN